MDHDVSGSVFSVGIIRAKPQLSTHKAVFNHSMTMHSQTLFAKLGPS
ncbi:hypothetical protein HMPREF9080_03032 [Cardiobacterium valvarum F0432]|uniref:Uncharacterized protein n=1 Tax=Cardiobacterium valvarum F0432 TaxID=797473 RepID=G9ZJR3_9GAMM|nr:hypothetical protein HMPREF9080_03032 [Cardiobacterium valvarum F0432]